MKSKIMPARKIFGLLGMTGIIVVLIILFGFGFVDLVDFSTGVVTALTTALLTLGCFIFKPEIDSAL